MTILVTGAAGFIGSHVAQRLLARGDAVVGLDNLNAYYDVSLKEARLARLQKHPGFRFAKLDLDDREGMAQPLRCRTKPQRVIHLAAQAGVRYSLDHPHAYVDSNLAGLPQHPRRLPPQRRRAPGLREFVERLRRQHAAAVLGARQRRPPGQPLRRHEEGQRVDGARLQPPVRAADDGPAVLHGVRAVGPARHGAVPVHEGHPRRPPIDVFNHGNMVRDFTYIDDIVEGVIRDAGQDGRAQPGLQPGHADPANSNVPVPRLQHRQQPADAAHRLHRGARGALGKKAQRNLLPMQPTTGTAADTPDSSGDVGATSRARRSSEGVTRFVAWYREYYGV